MILDYAKTPDRRLREDDKKELLGYSKVCNNTLLQRPWTTITAIKINATRQAASTRQPSFTFNSVC